MILKQQRSKQFMKLCKKCNVELINYVDEDLSCSCHIVAPCPKCCSSKLVCPECGELYDIEYLHNQITNNTKKIDKINNYEDFLKSGKKIHHITQRSRSWVILYGWYRCSKEEVFETIKKVASRPNGFSKYDMFRVKIMEKGYFKVSWCDD